MMATLYKHRYVKKILYRLTNTSKDKLVVFVRRGVTAVSVHFNNGN